VSSFTKIAMGVIGLAVVGTMLLPGRQTPAVLGGFSKLTTGTLSTAMGTSSGAIGG
jgi:hypothetical protein